MTGNAGRTIAEIVRDLEQNGPNRETRTDVDTASLVERYPHLRGVITRDIAVGEHTPGRLYLPPSAHDAQVATAEPVRAGQTAQVPDAALIWVHGGGFLGGGLDMPESNWTALELAAQGIPVLALDYRKVLNGVHFPAPSDDVLGGWLWATEHLEARTLHLGGASAGANLAAGVAKRLRDGAGPLPQSLVLVYPNLHPQRTWPDPSPELSAILATLPPDPWFPPETHADLQAQFLGATPDSDPYAYASNGDVAGQPPVLILNAERDPLRASGEEYGRQLAASGVPVRVEFEPGATHGHLDRPHDPEGRRSLGTISGWITQKASA